MGTVRFTQRGLGFFRTKADAAAWYDVSVRTLDLWLEKAQAPSAFEDKILDAGKLFTFPLDFPPSANVIGTAAHAALLAIRGHRYSDAAAISFTGLHSDKDWAVGKKPAKPHPIHAAFLQMANAIAWTRHTDAACQKDGFADFRALRRDTGRRLKELQVADPERQYWEHVHAMSTSYALVRLCSHTTHSDDPDARLTWLRGHPHARRRLTPHCRKLLELSLALQGKYAMGLVAWNVAQLAALDDDDALFIDALDSLLKVYSRDRARLIGMLELDCDTGMMLEKPRVKSFLNSSLTSRARKLSTGANS